jgi:choline dehydrogenase-like flavoprotein
MDLITTFDRMGDISEKHEVVIVGSGPASVAAAEKLYYGSACRITVLERGPLLLATHFNNLCPNSQRREFINAIADTPWRGDMRGGLLVEGLGGRGIVSGSNRPRFYEADFNCFESGKWPKPVVEALPGLYDEAERNQRISVGEIECGPQKWAAEALRAFRPAPPRIAFDSGGGGFVAPRGYDSPVERLYALMVSDGLRNSTPRLRVVTECYVARILHDGRRVLGVSCYNSTHPGSDPIELSAEIVIVGGSTIESARLVLNSGLGFDHPAVGRFLAEHIERRAKFRVSLPCDMGIHDGISLVLPPPGLALADRYQLHLRASPDRDNRRAAIVECGVFGAVAPSWDNRVTIAEEHDEFGVPRADTHFKLSAADSERARAMEARIEKVVAALGGEFITEQFPLELGVPQYTDGSRRIEVMAAGRSYHEAGTIRMGLNPDDSACDLLGRLRGMENLYVVDASLFPCVGVANPILTITALAYWVAQHICGSLLGSREDKALPAFANVAGAQTREEFFFAR